VDSAHQRYLMRAATKAALAVPQWSCAVGYIGVDR
jgi:hypothetical protein